MIRTQQIAIAALASLLPMAAAHAADGVSAADRSFVAMVSQGGMFEVMAGQLAADQGHLQDIRIRAQPRRTTTGSWAIS